MPAASFIIRHEDGFICLSMSTTSFTSQSGIIYNYALVWKVQFRNRVVKIRRFKRLRIAVKSRLSSKYNWKSSAGKRWLSRDFWKNWRICSDASGNWWPALNAMRLLKLLWIAVPCCGGIFMDGKCKANCSIRNSAVRRAKRRGNYSKCVSRKACILSSAG